MHSGHVVRLALFLAVGYMTQCDAALGKKLAAKLKQHSAL